MANLDDFQREISALRSEVNSLKKKLDAYEKESNKQNNQTKDSFKKLEQRLLAKMEIVYNRLRKTQVIDRQKIIEIDQTVAQIRSRMNK